MNLCEAASLVVKNGGGILWKTLSPETEFPDVVVYLDNPLDYKLMDESLNGEVWWCIVQGDDTGRSRPISLGTNHRRLHMNDLTRDDFEYLDPEQLKNFRRRFQKWVDINAGKVMNRPFHKVK